MSTNISKNTFNPDYAIAPGLILEEILESRSISQTELAQRCGRPIKTINGIIHGKVSIVEQTALEFEKVLGVSATIWLNLENTYKIFQLKEAEKKLFEKKIEWAKKFPVGELVKRNLIKKQNTWAEKVNSLLEFFGVSSVESFKNFWSEELNIQFKHSPSYKSSPEAVVTWLRIGEVNFQEHRISHSYDEDKFKAAISKAREMTTNPDIKNSIKAIEEEFKKSGVVLLLTKPLPKLSISGSARWISGDNALIQLSLRHKVNDHFWFALFHECAHILLHKKKQIYIDNSHDCHTEEEKEADQYSSDTLIPKKLWDPFRIEFLDCVDLSKQKELIERFAKTINIAEGIIVGRLQHERDINFSSALNKLKEKIDW